MRYKDFSGNTLKKGDMITDRSNWIFRIDKIKNRLTGVRIDCDCQSCRANPFLIESKYFINCKKIKDVKHDTHNETNKI